MKAVADSEEEFKKKTEAVNRQYQQALQDHLHKQTTFLKAKRAHDAWEKQYDAYQAQTRSGGYDKWKEQWEQKAEATKIYLENRQVLEENTKTEAEHVRKKAIWEENFATQQVDGLLVRMSPEDRERKLWELEQERKKTQTRAENDATALIVKESEEALERDWADCTSTGSIGPRHSSAQGSCDANRKEELRKRREIIEQQRQAEAQTDKDLQERIMQLEEAQRKLKEEFIAKPENPNSMLKGRLWTSETADRPYVWNRCTWNYQSDTIKDRCKEEVAQHKRDVEDYKKELARYDQAVDRAKSDPNAFPKAVGCTYRGSSIRASGLSACQKAKQEYENKAMDMEDQQEEVDALQVKKAILEKKRLKASLGPVEYQRQEGQIDQKLNTDFPGYGKMDPDQKKKVQEAVENNEATSGWKKHVKEIRKALTDPDYKLQTPDAITKRLRRVENTLSRSKNPITRMIGRTMRKKRRKKKDPNNENGDAAVGDWQMGTFEEEKPGNPCKGIDCVWPGPGCSNDKAAIAKAKEGKFFGGVAAALDLAYLAPHTDADGLFRFDARFFVGGSMYVSIFKKRIPILETYIKAVASLDMKRCADQEAESVEDPDLNTVALGFYVQVLLFKFSRGKRWGTCTQAEDVCMAQFLTNTPLHFEKTKNLFIKQKTLFCGPVPFTFEFRVDGTMYIDFNLSPASGKAGLDPSEMFVLEQYVRMRMKFKAGDRAVRALMVYTGKHPSGKTESKEELFEAALKAQLLSFSNTTATCSHSSQANCEAQISGGAKACLWNAATSVCEGRKFIPVADYVDKAVADVTIQPADANVGWSSDLFTPAGHIEVTWSQYAMRGVSAQDIQNRLNCRGDGECGTKLTKLREHIQKKLKGDVKMVRHWGGGCDYGSVTHPCAQHSSQMACHNQQDVAQRHTCQWVTGSHKCVDRNCPMMLLQAKLPAGAPSPPCTDKPMCHMQKDARACVNQKDAKGDPECTFSSCIDLDHAFLRGTNYLNTRPCNDRNRNQHWTFDASGTIKAGTHKVVTWNGDKPSCFTAGRAGSTRDYETAGGEVTAQPCDDSNAITVKRQTWVFSATLRQFKLKDGALKYSEAGTPIADTHADYHADLCLSSKKPSSAAQNSNTLFLAKCNPVDPAQQFEITTGWSGGQPAALAGIDDVREDPMDVLSACESKVMDTDQKAAPKPTRTLTGCAPCI